MTDDSIIVVKISKDVAARLSILAEEEGASVEALAAEALADYVTWNDVPAELRVSDEEYAASIVEQRRQLAEGALVTYAHEDVMAEARAIIEASRKRAQKPKR